MSSFYALVGSACRVLRHSNSNNTLFQIVWLFWGTPCIYTGCIRKWEALEIRNHCYNLNTWSTLLSPRVHNMPIYAWRLLN